MENSESSPSFTLDKEFHEIVTNKEVLSATTEKFLNNLVDEITLGIIFDFHRKYKTDSFSLDGELSTSSGETLSNVDIFAQHKVKKNQYLCNCPNCHRVVAAGKFAPHLETCLGMRSSRRNRNRGNTATNSKEQDAPTHATSEDDDDDNYDDVDWNPGKKKDRRRRERAKPKKKSLR